ncbi:unnamed protein product [Larinioides sclopetarius]|uniref:Uncharacterized protein n=1 Tax=Larinioides sclopetarius TaxID=280406 RepID=A0AAV2AAD9_9ARAC
MELSLIALFLCCLVAFSEGYAHKFSPKEAGLSSDQAADFFRLLLSRYEADSSDYQDSEDPFGDDENLMLNNYDFSTDRESNRNLMPNNYDFPTDKLITENAMHPFRQAVEGYFREQMITQPPRKENEQPNPSTTTAPDGLASIPPASPEKGQKEYAMLRPPVDNHKKIEHWMKFMNENNLAMDINGIQKRKSVP